jgi:hypothetical protein
MAKDEKKGETDAKAKGGVRITCARAAGFRRAGVFHPAGPAEYPAGTFSAAQLAALRAEPALVVEEL